MYIFQITLVSLLALLQCTYFGYCKEEIYCPEITQDYLVVEYNNRRKVNSTAKIRCKTRGIPTSHAERTCLNTGLWSAEIPQCRVYCLHPGDIENGEIKFSNQFGSVFYDGSSITYECHVLYYMKGPQKILCQGDGIWTDEKPTCAQLRCPEITKPNLLVEYERERHLHSKVKFYCPSGSVLYGHREIRCLYNGAWSADIPTCRIPCNEPGDIQNGEATSAGKEGEVFFAGSSLTYKCDALHYIDGAQKIVCRENGTWSNEKPICKKEIHCPEINQENLLVAYEKERKINSKAKFSCTPEGFLNGPEEITCLYPGIWSSSIPHCEISCNDPGNIQNGEVKSNGKIGEVFYAGSFLTFKCDALHYMDGAKNISCLPNGTWSNEKPTCIKVDACEEQLVPVGGLVEYLPPFDKLIDPRVVTQRNSRHRMSRLPIGLNAKPPNLKRTTPKPELAVELPPGYHQVGTRAQYYCESRYYRLIGSRTRSCQRNGQWSGRPPTCIPVCGRSNSPRTPFIVNGNATDVGQWPWQAGLARYIPDSNSWYLLCGGSLISEKWILTAAHCVTYSGTTIDIDPDKFQIYLGKYNRSDSEDDLYVQTKKISEIHIHPDYDPGIFDADIALIQLESSVKLTSRVQPVCLPTERTSQRNLKSGNKGVVTGWGMNENNTLSDILQQAAVPLVTNEECERGYLESDIPIYVTENMFCAGYQKGRYDSCNGDSGGPLVFAEDSFFSERRWVLEGIVSWGSVNGCGQENQYSGYTTVSKFVDWIYLFL